MATTRSALHRLAFVLLFAAVALAAHGQTLQTLTGTILDAEKHKPILRVQAFLDGAPVEMKVDEASGTFAIANVVPGRHTLRFEKFGWFFYDVPVMVLADAPPDKLAVTGQLTWWARAINGYHGLVIMVLTLLANAFIIIEYYVLPRPSTVLVWVAGILGLIGILLSCTKINTELIFPYIVFIVVSLAVTTFSGQRYATKHAAEAAVAAVAEKTALQAEVAQHVQQGQAMIGREGVALTDLRFFGKGEFGNEILEVKSRKTLLAKGTRIRVVALDSDVLLVDAVTEPEKPV